MQPFVTLRCPPVLDPKNDPYLWGEFRKNVKKKKKRIVFVFPFFLSVCLVLLSLSGEAKHADGQGVGLDFVPGDAFNGSGGGSLLTDRDSSGLRSILLWASSRNVRCKRKQSNQQHSSELPSGGPIGRLPVFCWSR